jgi:hypothetical protein
MEAKWEAECAQIREIRTDLDAREATIAQTKTVRVLIKAERQMLASIQDACFSGPIRGCATPSGP